MKRKDWISILAFIVILSVSLIGQQFANFGSWTDAVIIIAILSIPMLLFFILAVFARNRKGNYVKFWRGLSYVAFAGAFIFSMVGYAPSFMHYFNVIGSQDFVKEKAILILDDTDKMFVEYKESTKKREEIYESDIQTAINQGHQYNPNSTLRKALKNLPDYNKSNLAKETAKAWFIERTKNSDKNNEKWTKIKPDFKNALINNFNIFTAAAQFDALSTQYDTYKKALTEDYAANCTEWEKEEGFDTSFTFANKESEWKTAKEIFTDKKFNFGMFLLFIILALLASSSYIFFKDSSVKTPKQRNTTDNAVYQLGHKL